jgi:predicted metal-binding protein
MNHDATCPTCKAACTWTRSETDYENGEPARTIYFHRCGDCRIKFTHTEKAKKAVAA